MSKKTKEIKLMIIENYIDWFTTDEKERYEMKENAKIYVDEDWVDEIAQSNLVTMSKVTYKGIDYPTRTFNVVIADEGERQITIATESLDEAIGTDHEEIGSEAESIDDGIYFYIADELLELDAKLICAEHLDEPMEFISEEF